MSETYGASIFGGQRVENSPTKEKQDRRMKLKNQGSVVPKGVWYPRECGAQGSVVPKGVWCPRECGTQGSVVPKGVWYSRECSTQGSVVRFLALFPGGGDGSVQPEEA